MSTSAIADKTQQRNILIAVCAALMAVIASVSSLNVAQQQLAEDLGADGGQILWIINAYTLALAALLLPIGAIGDRWGRKPVLLAGLVIFIAASIVAAISGDVSLTIAARAATGLGAAMIMPVTLSVITSSFPEDQKTQAIGIWTGVAGSGGIVGLFFSSWMVDSFDWRWAFAMPIALAALSILFTQIFVPNSKENSEGGFDTGGSVLSFLAIGGIVLGIHEGPEKGWDDPLTIAGLVVGVVALVAFFFWELRQTSPLLDVRLFKNKALATSTVTLLCIFAVMFAIFLVIFPFLTGVVGWTALRSAVGLMPMAVAMMPTSAVVAPQMAKKFGSTETMIAGMTIAAVGLATMAIFASVDGGYMSVLPGLIIMGFGTGLTMTPGTEAITDSLPLEKQGVASALNDTSREVGGAIGVALLGSLLNAGYRSNFEDNIGEVPEVVKERSLEGYQSALTQFMGGENLEFAAQVQTVANEAFIQGWTQSMWAAVVVIGSATAYLIFAGPKRSAETLVDVTDSANDKIEEESQS